MLASYKKLGEPTNLQIMPGLGGFAFVRFFDKHDAEVRIGVKEIEMKKNFFKEVEKKISTIITGKQFLLSLGYRLFERESIYI